MHSFAPRLLSRASASSISPIRSSNILTSTTRSSLRLQQRLPARRFYSSEPPKKSSGVKFWPFLVVVGASSFAYKLLVDQRAEMAALPAPEANQALPSPTKSTPTFSPSDVTVLFVLGGPGAGKGTQCARLVSDYGFTHLSAGDLLRAEQDRPGSQFGQLIKDYIKDGLIVPMEVTVQLLENAMTETIKTNPGGKARFLIDGFPRKMDQAVKFEEAVCPAKLVLFYDCPEDVMESRLLERGKTSGRADDNAESIRKRFRTFVETSMPVVDYFEKEGRVVKLDATPPPQDVYSKTRFELSKRLGI
ncbi:UMP-CMP kinase [Colletotrichum orchidophilum]|uniref:Uridylate kinase n=1 Tax=Colletotrichum orchidophilum TaxID=1209926 RepID=A0A1G4B2Y7_9PEZI|nr:UMP-CMP kinase [Colletotrichum orchidophilum]OHE95757.1 UMP-CMP kinase [Colletotrichum orchidophilum]